jgi:hypothetical protein
VIFGVLEGNSWMVGLSKENAGWRGRVGNARLINDWSVHFLMEDHFYKQLAQKAT